MPAGQLLPAAINNASAVLEWIHASKGLYERIAMSLLGRLLWIKKHVHSMQAAILLPQKQYRAAAMPGWIFLRIIGEHHDVFKRHVLSDQFDI